MSKEKVKHEDGFDHLEGALTSSEQFIEKNQKNAHQHRPCVGYNYRWLFRL